MRKNKNKNRNKSINKNINKKNTNKFIKKTTSIDDPIRTLKRLARLEPFLFQHKGIVIKVNFGVVRIYGCSKSRIGDCVLLLPANFRGLIVNLEDNNYITVLLLDRQESKVREKDIALLTIEPLKVLLGYNLLGRIINALGQPVDGKGNIQIIEKRFLETRAPSIIARQKVNEPLFTGIKSVDTLIPIGRGQRELILGDRQTGKTAIVIDTMMNQNYNNNLICIYVSIGQRLSSIYQLATLLTKTDSLSHCILVCATAADPATLQYLAPYSATTIAEFFRDKVRKDVLVIYDDLSKHANAYRQISLLLRRPPGREAYPGDVFYLHSRLLERSGKLIKANSITSFPIVETQLGDVSSYIPTNVISITDGQIYLDAGLFNKNIKPAISAGLSVSRVGSLAQISHMKKLAGSLKLQLAQYREIENFSKFAEVIRWNYF